MKIVASVAILELDTDWHSITLRVSSVLSPIYHLQDAYCRYVIRLT